MSTSSKVVLVTGGLGFLGAHVCRALVQAGWRVRVGDLPGAEDWRVQDLPVGAWERCDLDITRPESAACAVAGVHGVVHLAAAVKDVAPWREFRRLTVEGTRNMVAAAEKAGAKRFVHVSSVAVHAFKNREHADENTPADATLRYGRAKAMAEAEVQRAQGRGKLQTVIVRPGLVPYGPGDTLALPQLVEGLKKGVVTLVGGGRGLICTAFAPDFAQGVALCLKHPKAVGETFILADEKGLTWKEYFETVARVYDVPPPRLDLPAPVALVVGEVIEKLWTATKQKGLPPLSAYRTQLVSNSHHFVADKARRVLGFAMTTPFEEGLRQTRES